MGKLMTFAKLKCFLLWHLKRGAWKLFWKLLHIYATYVGVDGAWAWWNVAKTISYFFEEKFKVISENFGNLLNIVVSLNDYHILSNLLPSPRCFKKWQDVFESIAEIKNISHKLPCQSLSRGFFVISPTFKQIS